MNHQTNLHRNHIIQAIRNFFNQENFLEVETPIMVPTPGIEPHITAFSTKHSNGTPLFLHTSPEFEMKRLLAKENFNQIFQITKTFRNEPNSQTHNPEFTILEWYRRPADYINLMEDCQKLLKNLCKLPFISEKIRKLINQPWKKISTRELFLQNCQIDLLKNTDYSNFKKSATEKRYDIKACQTWDDIFFKIFLNHIEPKLGTQAPTIIYNYPHTQAILAKRSKKTPFFSERLELYISRLELANGFSELTNAKELRQRIGKTTFPIDEEFLSSLKSITEPAAGIALGLDRLIMLLLEKNHISEVINFPLHVNNN